VSPIFGLVKDKIFNIREELLAYCMDDVNVLSRDGVLLGICF
jgi:hypothetical protein